MLDNLKLKKGEKVLIISELLDEMGLIKRLEKRTKFKIKDADIYVYEISRQVRSARIRPKFADKEPQDKEARSVFYYAMPDAYPDNTSMSSGCRKHVATTSTGTISSRER